MDRTDSYFQACANISLLVGELAKCVSLAVVAAA